jgi:hypothetical protein
MILSILINKKDLTFSSNLPNAALIIIVFGVFCMGIQFLDNEWGTPRLNFDNYSFSDPSGFFMVGNNITIKSTLDGALINGKVEYTFYNGSKLIHYLNNETFPKDYTNSSEASNVFFDKVYFKSLENVISLDITIETHYKNESFISNYYYPINFLTLKEYKERRSTYITYLLALIGLLIFTLPKYLKK